MHRPDDSIGVRQRRRHRLGNVQVDAGAAGDLDVVGLPGRFGADENRLQALLGDHLGRIVVEPDAVTRAKRGGVRAEGCLDLG